MIGDGARPHVVILGPMGAGKTTVADALQGVLGWPIRDSDPDLRLLTGRTGAEIAAEDGVERLHRLEAGLLLGTLADERPTIAAAAASIVDDPTCRAALGRRALAVVLSGPADRLYERAVTGGHRRSMRLDEYRRLFERRAMMFARVADLSLDAFERPDRSAAIILAAVPGATDRGLSGRRRR